MQLDAATLNRTTLARQLLLERAALSPVEAIERLVALQAQEPASPYIALWSRVRDFDAESLRRAFAERDVVKSTLFRVTLHAVSARDYARFWPALEPMLRQWREASVRRFGLGEIPLDELTRAAHEFLSEPRTAAEIRAHLPPLAAAVSAPGMDAWWAVRPHLPFLHVPSDAPWSFGRRQRFVAADAWLDHERASETEGLDHFVRRYLAGFGPATLGDMAQFTRLPVAPLRAATDRLADELTHYKTDGGKQLFDVADAPIAAADTPAPPRLLPMWDSVLLAYRDRSRVLPEPIRRRVIQPNGDFLPAVLVEGYVVGVWRSDVLEGRATVRWHLFEPIRRDAEDELAAEAERLAAFIEPIEPATYRRYATTWMKDLF